MSSSSPRGRLRSYAAGLSAALLALLAVENIRQALGARLPVSPDSLEQASLAAIRSPENWGRNAVFYHVANRIAGATVIMPPHMRPWIWEWQYVARIEPRFGEISLFVAEERLPRLRKAMPARLRWLVRDKTPENRRRTTRAFYLLPESTAKDYVLAESRDGEVFVISADRYQEVAEPEMTGYFRVARNIAGATVTLPPEMHASASEWERAAQVKVRLGDQPLIVPEAGLRRLRRRMPRGVRWRLERGDAEPVTVDFYLAIDPAAHAYVLWESRDGLELFLTPATSAEPTP